MKTSTQLNALIRNLSKEKKINAEILLRNYMLQRLLERIASSGYRDNFILKGGMLISSIVGIESRATMDMDVTVKGLGLGGDEIERVIEQILAMPMNDEISMKLLKIEDIREESEYSGMRVSIQANLDKTKQTLKLDITAGDRITPDAIEYPFKLMLGNQIICIWAYTLETVVAEKLETILSRGTSTTRMRDYYDLYILMHLYENALNPQILKEAFHETTRYRGTYVVIMENVQEYLGMIENSKILFELWEQYRTKNPYAYEISWSDALISLKKSIQLTQLM